VRPRSRTPYRLGDRLHRRSAGDARLLRPAQHPADVEDIPIRNNEAGERMVKSDVKYRFSIDMASLKTE